MLFYNQKTIVKFLYALTIFLLFGVSFFFSGQADSQPLPPLAERAFGPPLNTQNDEYNPIISPDGRYLVFQSNRPGGEGEMDLWLAENANYKSRDGEADWRKPVNLNQDIWEKNKKELPAGEKPAKLLNTDRFEGGISIRFDDAGNPTEIFFTSVKNEKADRSGYDALNIYYTKRDEKTKLWIDPIPVPEINSNFNDKMPAISPDGRFLIFASDRPGGYGEYDLWVSYRNLSNGSWSAPVNMGGTVNSKTSEILPYIHPDGEQLYFSTNRENERKKFSLFRIFLNLPAGQDMEDEEDKTSVSRTSLPYPVPDNASLEKLPFPFNLDTNEGIDSEGISFDREGIWAYVSSNRIGGQGQYDIYRFQVPESLRNSYDVTFEGLVLDGSEATMIGLDATIKISDAIGPNRTVTSKRIGGDLSKGTPSNFKTVLKTGRVYKVEISSPGFYPTEDRLDLRGNIERGKKIYKTYVLLPIKEEEKGKTQPQTFDESKKFKGMKVVVVDAKTKEPIPGASATVFTPKNRQGEVLKYNNEEKNFHLPSIPDTDFEIFAKAEKYISESVNVLKENAKDGSIISIALKQETDVPVVLGIKLYFEFNKTNLTDGHRKQLDLLVDYLKKNTSDKVEIGGHTDNIASKEYNTRLSGKRARNVYDYVRTKGIQASRLKTRAYWYSRPDEDNSTEQGRAKNRRVDFRKL
ncbi:OmpA family protein [Leptospira fainei serovar Hurstbridge str. BUT 6]|uniref:OmpA family protein n=1 Tax=Leptospira fainei serovar Hurstbridge str. BUT 6 TaxID=1193011 RepID=S3VBT4_9LEPT|nr:OmpA family protein [Leptospira fainei]EPG73940.1 OmpA family protein [Leptospira fainei serovar Hurstbridge str. BUT 6]